MSPDEQILVLERDLARAETEREQWRWVAWHLADALRFHEDRRINPTSRGGPALAAYDAQRDGRDDA